jgi:hypothetical protein
MLGRVLRRKQSLPDQSRQSFPPLNCANPVPLVAWQPQKADQARCRPKAALETIKLGTPFPRDGPMFSFSG